MKCFPPSSQTVHEGPPNPVINCAEKKKTTHVLDDFTWQSIDQDRKVFAGRCRKRKLDWFWSLCSGHQSDLVLVQGLTRVYFTVELRFTNQAGQCGSNIKLLQQWIISIKQKIMSALKPIHWTFCYFSDITYIEESSFTNYCNSLWTLLLES